MRFVDSYEFITLQFAFILSIIPSFNWRQVLSLQLIVLFIFQHCVLQLSPNLIECLSRSLAIFKLTLKEETFAGRNFRGFAVFCPFRESFFRKIFQNGPSAKVSSREMFQNGSSPKVFSRKLLVYFTYFLRGEGGGGGGGFQK